MPAPLVFLSHAYEDGERVQTLYAAMVGAGLRPWVFHQDAHEGSRSIRQALDRADAIVLFLSQARVGRAGLYDGEQVVALQRAESADHAMVIVALFDDVPVPAELAHLPRVRLFATGGRSQFLALLAGRFYAPAGTPEPPLDLVERCREGRCVLFTGGGIAAAAGLPTWSGLVQILFSEATAAGILDSAAVHDVSHALRIGDERLAADRLLDGVGDQRARLLGSLPRHLRHGSVNGPAFVSQLARVRFSGVVSLSLDDVAAQAFAASGYEEVTTADAEGLVGRRSQGLPFFLRLFGNATSPAELEAIRFTPSEFGAWVSQNRKLTDFLESLLLSNAVLFVAMSLETLADVLSTLRAPPSKQPHYVLTRVENMAWRGRAAALERRFGVRVLPFADDGTSRVLDEFVQRLRSSTLGPQPQSPEVGQLASVRLENIGPFQDLAVDLTAGWNLVLGDNGVGKTTLLRAITAALTGRDAEDYCERLLRHDSARGTITIRSTTGGLYRTTFERSTSRVEVRAVDGQPREVERWLAVAFPALRSLTATSHASTPTEPSVEDAYPLTDLLPMLARGLDPRGDQLKGWLLELDHRRLRAQTDGNVEEAARLGGWIQQFVAIAGKLVGQVVKGIAHIDPTRRTLLVSTTDGPMPFEALSQGVGSLLSWVGWLFRRQCEVYPRSQQPACEFAIVLLDEIDAHLHPAWQGPLTKRLSGAFPKVQFIATTHSPMIVGGHGADGVVRLARGDDGAVLRVVLGERATAGTSDQLLTSALFDVDSAVDAQTATLLEQYHRAFERAQQESDGAAVGVAEALRREIDRRIGGSDPDRLRQRVMSVVESVIESNLKGSEPAEREHAVKHVQAMVTEVLTRWPGGRHA